MICGSPVKAAPISCAFRYGRLVTIEEMRSVDLVVSGSVAVNRIGTRVGKGEVLQIWNTAWQ